MEKQNKNQTKVSEIFDNDIERLISKTARCRTGGLIEMTCMRQNT